MRIATVKVLVIPGVLLGLGLVSLLLHHWVRATENRRWEEMRLRLAEMARESRARPARRPVLRGEARSGNAWDHYAEILSISPISDLIPAGQFRDGDPKADRAKAEQLVSRFSASLNALRRGASTENADRSVPWEEGMAFRLGIVFSVGALAPVKARFLAEEGRPREAAELLLDACQFGLDGARNSTDLEADQAMGVVRTCLNELRSLIVSGVLGREDLLEVDRELDVLDRSFPRIADCHLNDAMALGFTLLEERGFQAIGPKVGLDISKIPTWRFCFSERLVIVDAFETSLSGRRRLGEAEEKPWKEAREIKTTVLRTFSEDRNLLVRLLCPPFDGKPYKVFGDIIRDYRAQLRLIRIAVRYAATGEFLALEDPFGGMLRSTRTGDRLKAWSIGGDGVDDGGAGEWKPSKETGKDIVLEMSLPKH
jgi:hypothetical protein